MSSRKTSQQEIFCLRRVATAKKSDRKACVIMHVQSGRSSNLMFCLLKPIAWIFLTLLRDEPFKLPNKTNRTDISFLIYGLLYQLHFVATLLGKSLKSRAINLNAACGFSVLFTPVIESALRKMWLKVERSSLQFINLDLLRNKQNENWTFWGSPFTIGISVAGLLIVGWPD